MTGEMQTPTLERSISVLPGFPFSSAQFTTSQGTPLIRIRDLLNHSTETNFIGVFDPVYLVRPGDILIGMDGDFSVVRWKGAKALLNQRVCKVSATDSEIDSSFLYWWLQPHVESIHKRTPQTTVRHLSVGDIYRVPRPPFPRNVQAYVAAVLDTVDETIKKTEAVIAKLKQVRASLLHDLLTRGLDEHGQLRDPIAHSEQFKDSPLGRIPREWEVVPVEKVGAKKRYAIVDGPFGSNLKTIHYRDEGIPVIQSGYVTSGEFLANSYFYVDQDLFTEQKRSAVEPGDIVMAKIGAQCGTCAILPHGHPTGILAGNSLKISTDTEICRTTYLLHLLHYYYSIGILEQIKSETAQPAISLKNLRALLILLPSVVEQDLVIAALRANKEMLSSEQAYLTKLHHLKSALMSDLLTGRVRVPADLDFD